MKKPDGFYTLTKDANLRRANYKVLYQLDKGSVVHTANDGGRVSKFKAGTSWYSPSNEHTWVTLIDGSGELDHDVEGWVEDGKLEATTGLQQHFQQGDKLYGRYEARDTIRHSSEPFNRSVRRMKNEIIDDINTKIMAREALDEEETRFKDFAEPLIPSGKQRSPRQWCKRAITHYTRSGNSIHFMLDGLSPAQFIEEITNNDRPTCTDSELRSLMRQRLADTHTTGGKNYGTDLSRVKFYLNYVEVAAPWEPGASAEWKAAWEAYKQHRRTKPQQIEL